MSLDVTRLDLRLRRRATIGYTAGIAAYTFMIVILYPAMRHTTGLDDLTENNSTMAALFGAVGSITSPVGWLNANVFVNFAPLIVLLVTIGYGAASIAGQNEESTLALVAVLPIVRRRIVAKRSWRWWCKLRWWRWRPGSWFSSVGTSNCRSRQAMWRA